MPLTSPGNDDDTGENHQPTLRKNTAEPVEQTLKQNNMASILRLASSATLAADAALAPPPAIFTIWVFLFNRKLRF